MKTKYVIGVIIIILVGIFIRFIWVETNSKSKNNDIKDIKIGVILPLTGDLSNPGKRILKGIQLAVSKINNKSKFHISLIIEDSEGKPEKAVNAYNKIKNIDKANIFIGDLLSSSTLAIAPLAFRNKDILISPTASSPSLSEYYPYFIRTYPSDYIDAKAASDYCFKDLNCRVMAIICWNNEYAIGLKDIFRKYFENSGGKIIQTETYNSDLKDFGPLILKLKGKHVDAVYLPGNPITNGNIIKKAAELNFKVKFFSNLSAQENDFLKIVGSASEGVYFSSPSFDIDSKDSLVKTFIYDYKLKFQQDPDIHSVKGFDAASILIKAFDDDNLLPNPIIDFIHKEKSFNLVSGKFIFDSTGEVSTIFSIKVYKKKNSIVTLKSYIPK
jgi:branched-chain amino acid transport system substrate-binding protein